MAASGSGQVLPSNGGEITVTTLGDLNNEDEDDGDDGTFPGP